MSENYKSDLKIIVIGQSGTGKTSFTKRWTQDLFEDFYSATIASEFSMKIVESYGKLYKIKLWDIGGQDKSFALAKIFAKDCFGCVVVSDSTDLNSLDSALKWQKLVLNETKFIDGDNIPFILVQNKIDLIENRKEFKKIEEKTKNIAENNNFEKYFMTSVKQNINVDESMTFLIDAIVSRLNKFSQENHNEPKEKKIKLVNDKILEGSDKKCC